MVVDLVDAPEGDGSDGDVVIVDDGPAPMQASLPQPPQQQQQPPGGSGSQNPLAQAPAAAAMSGVGDGNNNSSAAATATVATAAASAAAEQSPGPEGASCLICLEDMTSGGAHRTAALRCGHVFGESCIRQWLQTGAHKCPQCNSRARARDVTVIYNLPVAVAPAPEPRPEDTAAVARLQAELERERRQRAAERAEREALRAQLAMMAAQQRAAAAVAASAAAAAAGAGAHWQRGVGYQQQYGNPHQQQQQQQRLVGHKRPGDPLDSGGGGGMAAARSAPPPQPATSTRGAAAVAAEAPLRLVPLPAFDAASGGGSLDAGADGAATPTAAAGAAAATPRVAPGGLQVVQKYACASSRAFSLEGTTLLLAEGAPPFAGAGQGQQRLRKVSIFLPGAPKWIALPGATAVRALAPQPGGAGSSRGLVAVGTQGAGLLLASAESDAVVHRAALPGGAAVWSAAWSRACDQQLLLGLDHGRLALVDLRMTGREPHRGLLLMASGDALLGPQPLLRVAPAPLGLLGGGGGGSGGSGSADADDGDANGGAGAADAGAARNACVVATPKGLFTFSERGGGTFAPLLEAAALGGGTCEGVALLDSGVGGGGGGGSGGGDDGSDWPLLCASFRSKLAAAAVPPPPVGASGQLQQDAGQAAPRPAAHLLFRLAAAEGGGGAAAGTAAVASVSGGAGGALSALAQTAQLTGHASCRVVTAGAFARLPAVGGGLAPAFFSGDERGNTVAAWDCGSGAPLRRWQWPGLEGPAIQLSAVSRGGSAAPLVAALCESQLVLYEWLQQPLE